jgi:hypothetical protein
LAITAKFKNVHGIFVRCQLQFSTLLAVLVYLVWGAWRVTWLDVHGADGKGQIDISVIAPFLIIFTATALAVARDRVQGIRFLGYVLPLMMIPQVPHLPFVREFGYLVICALVLFFVLEGAKNRLPLTWYISLIRRLDISVLLLLVLLVIGVISATANYSLYGIWFNLKVGISEIILYFLIIFALFLITDRDSDYSIDHGLLMSALLVSVFVAVGFGIFGLGALAFADVREQNDTALGLAYYCRLKGSFVGPVHAGIFFATALPVLMHFARKDQSKWLKVLCIVTIVMCGVLVIATGSRSARLALLLMLAGGLLYKPYRRSILWSLPFCAFIFYYGFNYRCIEPVVGLIFGTGDPTYQYIGGDFFAVTVRQNLVVDSIAAWLAVPSTGTVSSTGAVGGTGIAWSYFEFFVRIVFGVGPGVAGVGSSVYQPHMTILDILFEFGILGLGLALIAVLYPIFRLSKVLPGYDAERQSASVAAILAFTAIAIGGLIYEVQNWLYVWYFFALILILAREKPDRRECAPAAFRPG